jgi:NADP-dependent 3-hydroxy acid dehydrogenase YdfG
MSDARAALCYIAVMKMGMSGAAVARLLNISRAGVTLAARRGENIYATSDELQAAFFSLPD